MTDDFRRLKNWRSSLNVDQHNHSRDGRNRRGRLHRDAQRAMAGIAFDRMHMRHLSHGQQRHQSKAQQRG